MERAFVESKSSGRGVILEVEERASTPSKRASRREEDLIHSLIPTLLYTVLLLVLVEVLSLCTKTPQYSCAPCAVYSTVSLGSLTTLVEITMLAG